MWKSLRQEKTLDIATYGTPCYGSMEEENSKNPLDRVFGKRPQTQKRRSTDGADRGGGDRAAKAGSLPRTSGRSAGCEAEAPRRGPHRTLSLPRRPLAEPGDQPEEKSLELSGRVPSRWRRGRVGDASGRRELPSRGGVAERRSFFFSCFFSSGEKFLGSEVARAGEPRCGRPSTAVAGGELLPRDVEGDAGSAEVSGIARAEDHASVAGKHAAALVPSGTASWRVERAGVHRLEGNHLVRGADRCADR